MIHFKPELKDAALELIKSKDNIDLFNDISELSNNITALGNYPTIEVLISAQEVNSRMHAKYPIIDVLIRAGTNLANILHMPQHQYLSEADCLKEYLRQDMYGILCHVLIKEKLIETVEQFIAS